MAAGAGLDRGYGDWFAYLFGFAEHQPGAQPHDTVREHIEVVGETMRSKVNGMEYKIGRFRTPTLQSLRDDPALAELRGKGRLTLRMEFGDVSQFHADPANEFATFQAASQFNCLEFVSPSVTPERGVTCYSSDRTQGPACAIACGPGTVYRNYFARACDLEGGHWPDPEQIGQSAEQQIENLRDLTRHLGDEAEGRPGRFFNVDGGYSMARGGRGDERLADLNQTLARSFAEEGAREVALGKIRLGVHSDVQVTSFGWGGNPVGRELFEDKKPPYAAHPVEQPRTVTQVYGSACSVAYSGNRTESWEQFAKLVLDGSYEATLLVALHNTVRHSAPQGAGPTRVFLTMLGGGVFGNEMEWIASAIERACARFADCPLDVRIVNYDRSVPPEIAAVCERF